MTGEVACGKLSIFPQLARFGKQHLILTIGLTLVSDFCHFGHGLVICRPRGLKVGSF